ncbi:uncharacterized protein RHOBADRAFT_51008 [Rhodotorula graminis WP1]|uniref:rRNA-processing protein EFG1 n=1 Tax=Rhodotorula graminis (strain WP1) TaxID=578459 RepID=A0A194SCU2_RHOGW|nr:uncharacterized protein RHOBADRAFT_51008 [Rhodotorula graminis WP1]KPV78553.1 hypothetical protein RHOBADRAFT_51008 [Rhodotorula graminis WP1]
MADSNPGPSRGTARGRGDDEQHGGVPSGSVSKLKAQLRQTKRLLAREDLNPDVRTTSERRLALLEGELVKAEQSNVEKKMVQRYRGVKFFERQKLLRKIKQAKKALADKPDSSEAQSTLLDARVDLYYVLRYPKTDKYVALFPDGVYAPFVAPSALAADATPAETKRQTLRAAIRKRLDKGDLPAEVELGELGIEGEEDVGAGSAKRDRDDADEEQEREAAPVVVDERAAKKPKRAAPAPAPAAASSAPTPAVVEAAEEEAAPVEGEGEPKKKENRKQRKERKRAEEAAAAAAATTAGAEPQKKALASQDAAMKDASWKSKTKAEQLVEQDDFFA